MNTAAIQIRQATLADLNAILQLCNQLVHFDFQFDPTLDLAWANSTVGRKLFEERIKQQDGMVLVATIGSNIVGYLVGGLIEPEPYRTIKILAELEEIFVNPDYRRSRAGTKLMQHFMSWCKTVNAEKISVLVSRNNHHALEFYKRNGFSEHNMILEVAVD